MGNFKDFIALNLSKIQLYAHLYFVGFNDQYAEMQLFG